MNLMKLKVCKLDLAMASYDWALASQNTEIR